MLGISLVISTPLKHREIEMEIEIEIETGIWLFQCDSMNKISVVEKYF